jgi:hypothetical protein
VTDEPAVAAAASAKQAIDRLGGGFMRSREALAAGERGGYRGWQMYFAGRCGVLGDVDADVVGAAVAFFEPGLVRRAWDASRAVEPRAAAVARYAAACQDWGRRRLDGFAGAQQLAELLEPVVAAASVPAAPLFAGWRAVARADDPPARVVQLAHVLREHRGAMHAVAVLACGLTAQQAVLAGPHGEQGARYFGWRGPFPAVDDAVRAARERAEALTDALEAPVWAALGDETAQCLGLLHAAAAHLRAAA